MPFDVPNIIFSFTKWMVHNFTTVWSHNWFPWWGTVHTSLGKQPTERVDQCRSGTGGWGKGKGKGQGQGQGEKTRDSKWQADKKPPDKQAPTLNTTVCFPHLNIIHIVFPLITLYFQHWMGRGCRMISNIKIQGCRSVESTLRFFSYLYNHLCR